MIIKRGFKYKLFKKNILLIINSLNRFLLYILLNNNTLIYLLIIYIII